jgi:hypothetical protein
MSSWHKVIIMQWVCFLECYVVSNLTGPLFIHVSKKCIKTNYISSNTQELQKCQYSFYYRTAEWLLSSDCSNLSVALIAGIVLHDCFWRSEDKKGKSRKSVDNKCCLCQTDFSCNNGKELVLQILRIIRFNDKTTRNQWRSTEKLVLTTDVFKNIISQFLMAYTTNEHITTDE